MFLLIRIFHVTTTNLMRIYIPLCFYLYNLRWSVLWTDMIFTFHYVSTYTQLNSLMLSLVRNLHSTMFLLIRKNPIYMIIDIIIYIPLCFYLYETAEHRQRPDTNLHSTMFLLIRRQNSWGKAEYSIYIPLCFYLYRLLDTMRMYGAVDLHSTMFLLILNTCIFSLSPLIPFTFHYVSTYTISRHECQLISKIYIPLCFYLYGTTEV